MSDLKIVPANTLGNDELARLLNQAYTDYYMPIWLEADQFEQMCREVDVDLARSVVALIDETPVGLALLSRRHREGWISGVGVRPQWRRRGIAQRIIETIQEAASQDSLDRLRLEVLAQNDPGIRLYERLGFEHARELLVLSIEAGAVSRTSISAGIRSAHPEQLLDSYSALHNVEPPWQRALPSLRSRAPSLQGMAFMGPGENLVGYVLYQPQHAIYAVVDLAVDPVYPQRIEAATELLGALHGIRTDFGGYIVNVPADAPILAAFTDTGYHVWHRQYEMTWQI
jgi:ribosomal protein S18 acetylase RimI-like enzyme